MRVYIPFPVAWDGMLESLEELKLEILEEQRARGRILTRYREYSSGPLTESHIAKVGEKPKLWDGQWTRVEYQYDVLVELIADREALVTVDANIRALQKPFLGGEKWVDIRSNGRLESDLMLNFGQRLFGQTFTLEATRKGFWQHEPGYVPDGELRPQITGPERRPPSAAALGETSSARRVGREAR